MLTHTLHHSDGQRWSLGLHSQTVRHAMTRGLYLWHTLSLLFFSKVLGVVLRYIRCLHIVFTSHSTIQCFFFVVAVRQMSVLVCIIYLLSSLHHSLSLMVSWSFVFRTEFVPKDGSCCIQRVFYAPIL